jgi:TPR repeat protein
MAQLCLGYCYENGDGVPADLKIALQWFALAAKQGEPKAQTRLGIYYQLGKGSEKSPEKAAHRFREAALRGDTCAMLNLGSCYQAGTGVKKDVTRAFVWWTLALQNGEENARNELTALRKDMSPEQVKDAEKRLKTMRDPRAWAAAQ